MNENRLLGFLGLLNRGGKLIVGESLLYSLKKVSLLLLATDAKENTLKSFHNKANSQPIKVLEVLSKEKLGQAIGFPSIAAIGVKDPKACKKIISLIEEEQNEAK